MHSATTDDCSGMVRRSERLADCHTCFKSPAVLRFEWSENLAIHCYSWIMSAAVCVGVWPTGQVKF